MDRRSFLLLPLALKRAFAGRLKITDVRVTGLRTVRTLGTLEPAWNPGGEMAFTEGGGSFIEVTTDQGLTGIGPGIAPDVLPAVKAQLVGKDPFDTEQHAARLRYYARGMAYRGSACVDIALWDLIGKACGQPLYKLFGGAKDKVTAYASMIRLSTPEERAELARKLKAEGWKAIKLRLHHETLREDIRTVEAVRKAVGDGMVIMTDANQAQASGNWQPGVLWDLRRAIETARELERLDCYWLEEPLPRYAFDHLAELNSKVEIAIAGGENNPGLHEFRQMLEKGAYDILQPECLVAEGITGLRKIGALAELYGKEMAPHNGGRYIGVVAHLHLIASWPHARYLEVLHDPPIGDYRPAFAIFRNPPLVGADGAVEMPQGAGLGVEIDPDLVLKG
ncbi:MAG: mandelate racemase/muconate lactonizing enzyme family protein [Bryobacteraceae bacterium]|nr:mandelate racemase/muconate lactonizing enzyme family protein [Bryobacteraceae bacterium]